MKYLLDTNALLYTFSAPSETAGPGPARGAFSVGLENYGDRPCKGRVFCGAGFWGQTLRNAVFSMGTDPFEGRIG